MIKSKGIFAVSFIAMMVAGGAYANIASQGYVDQQINTRQVAGNYATNTELSSVRTIATNAQSAAAAAQTAADEAQETADAAVATAQGSAAANKAVITNASGNITTGTISSAMITDGTITNADIATDAAIAASKVSGLGTLATKSAVTSAEITDGSVATADIADRAVTEAKLSDTVNASLDKADTALQAADLADYATKSEIPTVNNGKLTINVNGTSHSFTANQAGGTTVDIDIPDEVDFSGLSGSTTGSGNVVTNVTQTNGKVSATKGITAEVTSNRVTSANFNSNTSNDAKYPTVKAVADAINNAIGDIDVSTASGSGNVVTSVTQTNGKVSVTKGNVQIPVGSATATDSYATIWVE